MDHRWFVILRLLESIVEKLIRAVRWSRVFFVAKEIDSPVRDEDDGRAILSIEVE